MSKITEGKKENPGYKSNYPGFNGNFLIVFSLIIRQLIFVSNKVLSRRRQDRSP
jgi:hypothetical protein